jgi:hypothetical protein
VYVGRQEPWASRVAVDSVTGNPGTKFLYKICVREFYTFMERETNIQTPQMNAEV